MEIYPHKILNADSLFICSRENRSDYLCFLTFFKWSLFFFLGILFIFFSSCSKKINNLQTNEVIIYPPLPDTTRIQYLTSISNSANITGKRNWFSKFILGDYKSLPVVKPYGIAIYNGKLIISDAAINGLEIIDLNKKTFDYFKPSGKGQMKLPINCFVSEESGLLYVADAERHQIIIFDANNNYVDCFGEAENQRPTDVFVYKDKIYISDAKSNKVNVYNKNNHKFIFSFPEAEQDDTDFLYNPTNIFIKNDKIYISDFGDFKIKTYSLDGKFVNSIGTYGDAHGQFARPKGIAVDKEENLYVVDAGFENVQVFNNEGNVLMHFGGPYNGPGDMWLPAKVMIDYNNLQYFRKYVDSDFDLKYLIFVTNQYGPDKINVYGFVEPLKFKVGLNKKTTENEIHGPKSDSAFKEERKLTQIIPDTNYIKEGTPVQTFNEEFSKSVMTIIPDNEILHKEKESNSINKIIFKIQIAANMNPLPEKHHLFRDYVEKIDYEKDDDGVYHYYIGSFEEYKQASAKVKGLKSEGKDAFVIAVKDGKRISITEARKLTE